MIIFINIMTKTYSMDIDLELGKVIDRIKKDQAKNILLQLPDGLKPRAIEISDEIISKTGCRVVIWAGSCYGACDTPNVKGFDMLIQFGHSRWVN
jgi:2-(3-amino-3-carboxypropyl)histidine synthase